MALRNSLPVTFKPKGLSDAVDATNAFPGAMQALINLIPANDTANCFVPRPAALQVSSFAGFTTPGFVSASLVVGNIEYGMIASGRNAGHDEPYVYNLATGTFLVVSGITAGNTPTSPPSTGAWTPPILAVVGTKVVVTHPGFPGGATKFGWFDISTPGSPAWSAGDTSPNALPAVPVSVAQFNGRAFYAVNNGVVYSDSLAATTVTNASQALVFANGLMVTALGALPLSSPVTGGIIQAIIAFQGVSAMQQITGDQATSNLSVNLLNVATGTLSPLSITPSNFGLLFMSPEGMRVIEYSGQVSDPIGHNGSGVTVPFIYAVQPSRICAAATADVIRVTVQNGFKSIQPFEEYWFDVSLKVWTGPHSFPASLIQPWRNTFVEHPVGVPATTWRSDVIPTATTTYIENGVQMMITSTTTLMPDNQEMAENSMVETSIMAALPSGYTLTVSGLDETSNAIDVATITATGDQTIWGAFLWGAAPWAGNLGVMRQYRIPWHIPLVFKQASLSQTGIAAASLKLGNAYFKIERLGYLMQ